MSDKRPITMQDQMGEARGAEDRRDNAQSISGKVFDTDSNPVTARLLIWGPEDVDGEDCIIVEPTDFFSTAPDPNYDGDDHPTLAADDLRLAIPVGFFPPLSEDIEQGKLTAAQKALAEVVRLAEEEIDPADCVDPVERLEARRERIAEVARGASASNGLGADTPTVATPDEKAEAIDRIVKFAGDGRNSDADLGGYVYGELERLNL